MADDAKLRTVAGLSAAWDGEPIKRVRALDGFAVLLGRRVTMHLMAQPAVASIWLADRLLIEQGLLSRVLVTAPQPASGNRRWREPSPMSEVAMKVYSACLLDILERAMPLAPGGNTPAFSICAKGCGTNGSLRMRDVVIRFCARNQCADQRACKRYRR